MCRFARDEQRGLCLDCHDKVADDIAGSKAFTGDLGGPDRPVPELPH